MEGAAALSKPDESSGHLLEFENDSGECGGRFQDLELRFRQFVARFKRRLQDRAGAGGRWHGEVDRVIPLLWHPHPLADLNVANRHQPAKPLLEFRSEGGRPIAVLEISQHVSEQVSESPWRRQCAGSDECREMQLFREYHGRVVL